MELHLFLIISSTTITKRVQEQYTSFKLQNKVGQNLTYFFPSLKRPFQQKMDILWLTKNLHII